MGVGGYGHQNTAYQFYNVPPILPILQKVVLRLSEHGDVIETQTIRFVTLKVF